MEPPGTWPTAGSSSEGGSEPLEGLREGGHGPLALSIISPPQPRLAAGPLRDFFVGLAVGLLGGEAHPEGRARRRHKSECVGRF